MTVTVVSTGGTIASTPDSGGDASPQLTGEDLVSAVPELADVAEIDTEEFSNVPSAHFTIEQMGALARFLTELDDDPDVDGIVVTQGTDVLEESAYFVDLCYRGETPVVFTGAMRNPSLPSADGPANLLASVRAATDEHASGRVLVAFNDRVHAAREVTKTNSMNLDTFRSPEFGPLGVIDESRVTWRRTPESPDPDLAVEYDDLTNDVYAAFVTADVAPEHLAPARESDALCLATTGAGHIPPKIVPELESVVENGVPIVATTRCPEGRLARDTYGFRGSERTLQELGCYYGDLNLQKTRIRTIVGLAAGRLDDVFERPGE
ncbi:L-asparaginase [Halorubrum aquaticum]|uniref:L-asparaginase n=1 Tax=Halorubrum aquaticum TaxID=387340 RepID=A0A1I2Z4L6_9EURY|nr:asparaginase [Halorubrum aquaticum]SFH32499.1 L-asparaginase [Halorubrum aquaticum]